MSGSVNKVIILGNLCADPDVRTFANGGKVVNLRIATNERWKTKDGERKEKAEYHSVAIFSEPLCKVAESYLKKGSKVYIEGQLETRKWQDQSGADKYSTEIVLRPFKSELTMLDGAGGGQTGSQDRQDHGAGAGGRPSLDMGGDDIPFQAEVRV